MFHTSNIPRRNPRKFVCFAANFKSFHAPWAPSYKMSTFAERAYIK